MSTEPCFSENEEAEMFVGWAKELLTKCASRGKPCVEEQSIKEYCRLRREIIFLQACCANIEDGSMKTESNERDTPEVKWMLGDCARAHIEGEDEI